MRKLLILFIGLAVLVVGYFYREPIFNYFSGVPKIENTEQFWGTIENVAKEIITPPPLRTPKKEGLSSAALNRENILKWTNVQRTENNLPIFLENTRLNMAALNKAQDMIEGGYFAHVSPLGFDVVYWVDGVGYEYLAIGENLALGDFENEKELVQAWMDSPGHRANVLNSNFKEIGIGVLRGKYADYGGEETWLAVQIFGRPVSDCPEPDKNLVSEIEVYKKNLESFETSIALLRAKIDELSVQKHNNKNSFSYLVEEYNSLVNQYNQNVEKVKKMIEEYNKSVREFNACAADK